MLYADLKDLPATDRLLEATCCISNRRLERPVLLLSQTLSAA